MRRDRVGRIVPTTTRERWVYWPLVIVGIVLAWLLSHAFADVLDPYNRAAAHWIASWF